MESIRECVKLAEREAIKGKIRHEKEERAGSAWLDDECKVVNDRVWAARRNYSAARRAIPPLPQEDLKVLSQHLMDMRGDLQRMKRRKMLQVKHEMHRKLIRDYFSSSPQELLGCV